MCDCGHLYMAQKQGILAPPSVPLLSTLGQETNAMAPAMGPYAVLEGQDFPWHSTRRRSFFKKEIKIQ